MQEENTQKIKKFVRRLKGLRMRENLTQAELAAKIGVTTAAVGNWEGERGMPQIKQIHKLCELFGVPVNFLLGEGESDAPPESNAPPLESTPDLKLREGASSYSVEDREGERLVATTDPEAFVLAMWGDSMLPEIKPADELTVSPNARIESGDVVFAKKVNGEIMVRLYFERPQGKLMLSAYNPAFPPMEHARSDFQTLAAVLALNRRLKVRGEFKPGSKD